jgi:arginine decarboxylase
LNQSLSIKAVIQDITCDSDGRIDSYINGRELTPTLAAPPLTKKDYMAFFLVGAYQEILGDCHNLFGDAHAVDVHISTDNEIELKQPQRGDRVDELLSYVHFQPEELLKLYQHKLQASSLSEEQSVYYLKLLEDGMQGYTYLEEEEIDA